MQRIARFHFELKDGSPLVISYQLQDNSLVPRWIDIVNRRKKTNDELELKISNKSEQDLPELMEILNDIIRNINVYYDKQLPSFNDPKQLTREILNHLHEEFEEYGERHRKIGEQGGFQNHAPDQNPDQFPGTRFNRRFHEAWLKLNQYIHIIESATAEDEFPQFSCLVQYMPFEWGEPVTEIDKLFLDTGFQWGQLYLGYNTLGKDWHDAFTDNDQRLISNNQVKVQESFCSESWLNFNGEPNMPKMTESFYWQWWSKLDPEIQKLVPVDDRNKLALGRYYLGQVIIDNTFLDVHPWPEDWLIPNSEHRRRWNLDVFSQVVRATDIEII